MIYKLSLVVVLLLFGGLLLIGCSGTDDGDEKNEPETIQLAAPTNLRIESPIYRFVRWNGSSGRYYNIYINGELFGQQTDFDSFPLFEFMEAHDFEAGEHVVTIRATGFVDNGVTFLQSPLSSPFVFRVGDLPVLETEIELEFYENSIVSEYLPDILSHFPGLWDIYAVHSSEERQRIFASNGVATQRHVDVRQIITAGHNEVYFEFIHRNTARVVDGVVTFSPNNTSRYRSKSISFYGQRIAQPEYFYWTNTLHWKEVPCATGYNIFLEQGHERRQIMAGAGFLVNNHNPIDFIRDIGRSGEYTFELVALACIYASEIIDDVKTFFVDSKPKRIAHNVEVRNTSLFSEVRYENGYFYLEAETVNGHFADWIRYTIGDEEGFIWGGPGRIPIHQIVRSLASVAGRAGLSVDSSADFRFEITRYVPGVVWDGTNKKLAIIYTMEYTTILEGVLNFVGGFEIFFFDGVDMAWNAPDWAIKYEITNFIGNSLVTSLIQQPYLLYAATYLWGERSAIRALGWEFVDGVWNIYFTRAMDVTHIIAG